MQRVSIGTKVESLGIQKCNVADGVKARVVLVDPSAQMKYIAYDNVVKRRVEVDQDLLIKYNLKASPVFYYLIARLNTDMKGNVVSDDFTIEYLQLTNNVNAEFADAVAENPNFSSIVLGKVSKKGDGGKDFSYVKANPSNYQAPEGVMSKIMTLRQNPEAIESMWKLIDRATSITPAEYEELLASPLVKPEPLQDMPKELASPAVKAAPAIAAPSYDDFPASTPKQVPVDDFNTGDSLENDFNW